MRKVGVTMFSRRDLLVTAASFAASTKLASANTPKTGFDIDPSLLPQRVEVQEQFVAGQIIVVPSHHLLYWIDQKGSAMRYGVGVGKAGLEFTGQAVIQRKAEWPSWRPTNEMIAREPHKYEKFKDGVPGGPTNPLGARALYLYENGIDTYFRIHGTTQPSSIGRSVSNGCIRMINDHVIDLYNRVPVGTVVSVI